MHMILNTSDSFTGKIIRSKDYKNTIGFNNTTSLISFNKIQPEYILFLEYIALIAAAIINCPFGILYKSLSLCSVQKGEKNSVPFWNVRS